VVSERLHAMIAGADSKATKAKASKEKPEKTKPLEEAA
jgi:hypothetical protein